MALPSAVTVPPKLFEALASVMLYLTSPVPVTPLYAIRLIGPVALTAVEATW